MKKDYKRFLILLVEKEGNVSTKDVKSCGISFNQWFELSCRMNQNNSTLAVINKAKEILKTYYNYNMDIMEV